MYKIDDLRKHKLSPRAKYTILSVLICGLIAHLYMYTNRIVNHDAVFALKYSGSTITSGRWFLYILVEIAHMFNNNYITPWGIGVVVLILYAICACVLVKILNIKSIPLSCLLGSILITFPSVTSNNLYIFTAHYYALACLLACASVLVVSVSDKLPAILCSSLMITLSLGIYQAYLPLVLTLYVLLILLDCLNEEKPIYIIVKTAFKFLGALIGGLALYFLINQFFLNATGFSMEAYMGMNRMGKLEISSIPSILKKCYSSFIGLFLYKYHGINHKSWLRLLMLLCCLFFIAAALFIIRKNKIRRIRFLFFCVALIILPIAIGAIYIMAQEEKAICTMTIFATVFIFFAPICIADRLSQEISVNKAFVVHMGLCAALAVVSMYYSSLANETYVALEYSNQNTNAYFTELATQIKSLDGFSPDLKVAFIGDNQDQSIPEIDCDYIIRGAFPTSELVNVYSREYFMTMHCGYSCVFAENSEYLLKDPRVVNMPAYPYDGSIAIIDDIIVVKFSD